MNGKRRWINVTLCALTLFLAAGRAKAADGVYARFRLVEPKDVTYYVTVRGHIHVSPWYLPPTAWPEGADGDVTKRLAAGQPTPWFDVRQYAGDRLHGRINRSGGVAEFPNLALHFITEPDCEGRTVVVELATAADENAIVRRFEESFPGPETSVLVAPELARDKDEMETLWQMADRHLAWAREATGGTRVSPKELILQTSFYGGTIKDAEALWLLGFNVVGNQSPAMHEAFPALGIPGHTHAVKFGPAATREEGDSLIQRK